MKDFRIEHLYGDPPTEVYEFLRVTTYADGRVELLIDKPPDRDFPYDGVRFLLRGEEAKKLKKAL